MKYTVYKITNELDGKIYIGVHRTKDVNDDYMGSGLHLKRAQEKYGIENFTKEILEVFNTPEMMFQMESILVNKEFVQSKNNYNLIEGGQGGDTSKYIDYSAGWLHKFSEDQYLKGLEKIDWLRENDPDWVERKWQGYSKTMIQKYLDGYENPFKGKKHSEETLEKLRGHKRQSGKENSQYGSMWIYNLELKENRKIPKGDIPEGWLKGRKMKF